MKPVEHEVIFERFVVAIGVRSMFGSEEGEPKPWEVYLRLVSGTDVVVCKECSREEALTLFNYRVAEASLGNAYAYIITNDDAVVNSEYIVRVFVDKHGSGHVCLIEDSTGVLYNIMEGTEAECSNMAQRLGRDIVRYTMLYDDDDDIPSGVAEPK